MTTVVKCQRLSLNKGRQISSIFSIVFIWRWWCIHVQFVIKCNLKSSKLKIMKTEVMRHLVLMHIEYKYVEVIFKHWRTLRRIVLVWGFFQKLNMVLLILIGWRELQVQMGHALGYWPECPLTKFFLNYKYLLFTRSFCVIIFQVTAFQKFTVDFMFKN